MPDVIQMMIRAGNLAEKVQTVSLVIKPAYVQVPQAQAFAVQTHPVVATSATAADTNAFSGRR